MVFGLQRAKSTTEQGIQQRSTGEQCVPSEVEALPTQRKLILPTWQISVPHHLFRSARVSGIYIYIYMNTYLGIIADQEEYPKLHTTVNMRVFLYCLMYN